MYRYNNLIKTFILFALTAYSASAQSGLKLGLGSSILLGNDKTITVDGFPDIIEVKKPIGITINADYVFNPTLSIKSGLEYRFQNLKLNNAFNFRAEYFSIPLMLDYKLIKGSKNSIKLGVSLGISFDKMDYFTNEYNYSIQNGSDISKLNISVSTAKIFPQKALQFDAISFRFGISAVKKIAKIGELNIFANYNLPIRNYFAASAYYIRTSNPSQNLELTLEYEKEITLSPKGLQIGVYYTFGTLSFKKD